MADKVNRYAANWRSLEDQTKRREANLKLEDQKLIKRYDTNIEEAKRGNLKSGFTQTSLTGMKQNWSEIPQKQGLSTLDTQIRNLIYASNNAQSDQEAGAYMAAAWELQNKWDVQEDQETTYTRAATKDMTAIDQNQQDRDNMSPAEFFGVNQYGEGGSADPTNVADTTSSTGDTSVEGVEQNTLKEKGIKENNKVEISNAKKEDNARWSGEVGSRTLNKISPIQQKLLDSGHSQEGLIKLMEKNQDFQANRPKVSDLLKIFKK
tara:strand:- start:1494 stop:2285 length:792 start_codon:yes stop_codon:yes gene_type:complete